MRERRPRVVVVDDRVAMAETIADGLVDHGFDAMALGSGRAALEALRDPTLDVLVTDLRMPDVDGLALLSAAHTAQIDVPIIVMTAYGAIDSAVESIRKGAYHYLTKPFKLEELVIFVRRAIADRELRRESSSLRKTLGEQFSRAGIVARSVAMQRVLTVVERIAPTDVPVLIKGETGTGKGVLARTIHGESLRATRPFVTINCAAMPESLLESELFGHVKGAFTGATSEHAGLFAEADGGTMLLDEIAEMSPALQAKLLHVLESGTVRPVGSARERPVDVRVFAATHRDLHKRIIDGTFREDLMYRLNVVSVEVPALRQRREDIPLLVDRFLADARQRHPRSVVCRVSRGALRRLVDYSWPGNVRELAHVVERSLLLAAGEEITEADVAELSVSPSQGQMGFGGDVVTMQEIQRRYARWALAQLGGHKTRTAEALDLDAKTLARLLADEGREK